MGVQRVDHRIPLQRSNNAGDEQNKTLLRDAQ
jgi:hypothetical protein